MDKEKKRKMTVSWGKGAKERFFFIKKHGSEYECMLRR